VLFGPLSLQKVAIIAPFFGTCGVFSAIFKRKGSKLPFFLIGGQNRNISKLKGRKVQFSLFIIQPNLSNFLELSIIILFYFISAHEFVISLTI